MRNLVKTFAIILIAVFSSCDFNKVDYTKYVDPFIGTAGHGHTFPGATTPFGMVQLSPDTGTEGWDWCSGYHDSDSSIIGFSHTHLSGTGGADYGDILLMPVVGDINFNPGTKDSIDNGYRSRFSKDHEIATPGYYAVILQDYNIKAELTASPRTGLHRYTFPSSDKSHIILDLVHGISDSPKNAKIEVLSSTKIQGFRRSQGWASDQWVYFAIEFSKPFHSHQVESENIMLGAVKNAKGPRLKAALQFKTEQSEQIIVKVGISSVSEENAWSNIELENPKVFDFDNLRFKAKKLWQTELAKIEVETANDTLKKIFYTAMYHSKIHPNLFQDSDNRYRGMDKQIHQATKHQNYTLYSLWDTFRALHPLFSITDKQKNNEFIKSMLVKYQESGKLPVWELWSNETNTMIGYHAIPVIADAILKGYANFDTELAFEAMKKSAMDDSRGLNFYKAINYIPRDQEANSVSQTLEYAFDDYAIAQVAKKLGKRNDYSYFSARAFNYRMLFDDETMFMRGRDIHGRWNPDFDPMTVSLFGSGDFTEGNAWHYSFFAPHDIDGLIDLYGGSDKFVNKLDQMFEQKTVNDNEHALDVTGLKGQYAQGNEPSHHVIYTYNFAKRQDRTQKLIRDILKEMYTQERDGLSGNEDTGQMSAWYIFSSMGFYPMNPVGGQYIIGSPIFDKVTIHLENGNTFSIVCENNSEQNFYIQSASLNQDNYDYSYIDHQTIENGGTLTFKMGPEPSKWALSEKSKPISRILNRGESIEEHLPIVFMPYAEDANKMFKNLGLIQLRSETEDAEIYYTLDGSEPDKSSSLYTKQIILRNSANLKAIAYKEGHLPSPILDISFRKAYFNDNREKYPIISLKSKTASSYSPSPMTLIDGEFGTNNFRDGKWTGIQGDDLVAIIDLGKSKKISTVSANFIQNTGSWIFPPRDIQVYTSLNGRTYQLANRIDYEVPKSHLDIKINTLTIDVKKNARFVKLVASNVGILPEWHGGSGKGAYIFVDEIILE